MRVVSGIWSSICLIGAFGSADEASSAIRQEAGPAAQESRPAVRFEYGDGLRFAWRDARLRVRTRLHMDLVDPDLKDVGEEIGTSFERALELRRARWLADLRFEDDSPFADVRVRAQVDFASSAIDWKDLYVRYDGLGGLGFVESTSVRLGHFREPFGMEAMTSVSHLAFIERSMATGAFTPGRARGAAIFARGEAGILQLGAFRASAGLPFPNELGEETALTARLLWQRRGEGALAQAGGSVSVRDANDGTFRFSARPGTRLLARVVDTGRLNADRFVTAGAEVLALSRHWTLSAECFGAFGDGGDADDARFSGAHVAATRFLGEGSPSWRRARGGLTASIVDDAWTSRDVGNGDVELAARLTWVDLDDGPVRGGEAADLELGVNWYLQPTTRFMLHWVGLRAEGETGGAILGRIQLQF